MDKCPKCGSCYKSYAFLRGDCIVNPCGNRDCDYQKVVKLDKPIIGKKKDKEDELL